MADEHEEAESRSPDPRTGRDHVKTPVDKFLKLLHFWFGLRDEVGQREYAASGVLLSLVKYVVEALLVFGVAERFYTPLNYLSPVFLWRSEPIRFAPEWVGWAMFLWTLPFVWIAVSMSVRRAINAGGSPWVGLLVLVPFLNYLTMLALCLVPASPHRKALEKTWKADGSTSALTSAALGLLASLVLGGAMLWLSVYTLNSYGAMLFLGTPLVMGAVSGYFFNRSGSQSYEASMFVGFLSTVLAMGLLLALALEGVICLAMAVPLVLPLGFVGGAIGKLIADVTAPDERQWLGILLLPALAGIEAVALPREEFVVLTTVEIDAPLETVWNHVIQFPELPEAKEWYFRAGIAFPQRARIVGEGVGAIRYCEFTTGAFVEPITDWEYPRRLAFDVTKQPDPMFELSPYQHVHPPHLHGTLRSNHGEFKLVELPDGRTRLEGRTWYELDMLPRSYWTLWSDFMIHRIHTRVLEHIKQLAEQETGSKRTGPVGTARLGS